MEEQLISFKTAKLAKEKEFDIICKHFYSPFTNSEKLYSYGMEEFKEYNGCFLPTQSLLQKWLREKHKIDVEITHYREGYVYLITTST